MTKKFVFLAVLFSVSLISANIFETKVFVICGVTLTGGFLIFPISYIVNDCLSEVYGLKNTRFVIWLAFLMNIFFLAAARVVMVLPSPDYWVGAEHFSFVFNMNLRVTAASMAAFPAGSLVNATVMSGLRRRDGERLFARRAILSTLAGESLDSLIFFPIAFRGMEWRHLITIMLTQVVLKTVYEIVILPLTSKVVSNLRENP